MEADERPTCVCSYFSFTVRGIGCEFFQKIKSYFPFAHSLTPVRVFDYLINSHNTEVTRGVVLGVARRLINIALKIEEKDERS